MYFIACHLKDKMKGDRINTANWQSPWFNKWVGLVLFNIVREAPLRIQIDNSVYDLRCTIKCFSPLNGLSQDNWFRKYMWSPYNLHKASFYKYRFLEK